MVVIPLTLAAAGGLPLVVTLSATPHTNQPTWREFKKFRHSEFQSSGIQDTFLLKKDRPSLLSGSRIRIGFCNNENDKKSVPVLIF